MSRLQFIHNTKCVNNLVNRKNIGYFMITTSIQCTLLKDVVFINYSTLFFDLTERFDLDSFSYTQG